jgi:hypothetical protein
VSWICLQSSLPNYSVSFFTTQSSTPIPLYRVSCPSHYCLRNRPFLAQVDPKQPTVPTSLRMDINCQSLNNKHGKFQNVIDDLNPDIVVAIGIWLSKNIQDRSSTAPTTTTGMTEQHKVEFLWPSGILFRTNVPSNMRMTVKLSGLE